MEKVVVEGIEDVRENEGNGFYDKELEKNFKVDLLHAIEEEYGLNKAQAVLVYDMSYEEGHSSGHSEIANYANDFADFARDILNA